MTFVPRLTVAGLLGAATLAVALAGPASAAPAPASVAVPASVEAVAAAPVAAAPATAVTSDAMLAGYTAVTCGDGTAGDNYCVSLRRAMIRDGYRLGPLRYSAPGCTAPGGCFGVGWWFVYYW